MHLQFDDDQWQRLQEDLNTGLLCGDSAGKLYAFAKGSMQRAVAAIAGEKDVTPEEARHSLELLNKLRHASQDAAHGFADAVELIDSLIAKLEPPRLKSRRRLGETR